MRMRKFYLILFASLIYNALFSQEVSKTDSLKKSFGVSSEIEMVAFYDFIKPCNAFILIGLDYNHKFRDRISFGATASFGLGDIEFMSPRFKIMPYARFNNKHNGFLPFLDIGLGYSFIYWQKRSFYIPYVYGGKEKKDYFSLTTRAGWNFVNTRKFTFTFLIQYSKLFTEGAFYGFSIVGSYKR